MKSMPGATFLLLFIFAFGMALAEDSHRPITPSQDEYERIIREIETKKKKHDDLQRKEESILDSLDRLAFSLNSKNKELRILRKEISQTKKAITVQENEMNRLRDQMLTTEKQIQTRVTGLYKMSKVGPWAYFLSAENYGDLLRMFNFMSNMVNHDLSLLAAHQNQLERRGAINKELKANQTRLMGKEEKVRRKAGEVSTLRLQQKRALRRVRAAKTSSAKLIEELEKQAQRLQSLIETLPSDEGKTSQRSSGFRALKGRLPLPVEGKIEKNAQKGLRGLSLKARRGATVRAVYRGRVVYADWFKGYGNLLIIYHGDRFHTVMGHVSELLKMENDWVEAGESVARVGGTGPLGGPSLYFEIRQDGKPVDLLEWFSREDQLALK